MTVFIYSQCTYIVMKIDYLELIFKFLMFMFFREQV